MSAAFRVILIAVLLLTSQGLAVARGQARVAGEMVLCAGGELMTVQVDEQGKPVERVVICPDMALNLMSAVAAPTPAPKLTETVLSLALEVALPCSNGRDAPVAQARAPPARRIV
jgi:hypothetical protein